MPRYFFETSEDLTPAQLANIAHAGAAYTGVAPFVIKPEAKTLHIVGRRWFQKTYGNTYHTVEVFINGQKVFKSERQYGYGDQYLTTAVEWLQQAGHLPSDYNGHMGTRYLREESGFTFSYDCHDVQRQKDL